MGGSENGAALARARTAVGLAGSDPKRARMLATAVLGEAERGLPAAEAERALGMAARHELADPTRTPARSASQVLVNC